MYNPRQKVFFESIDISFDFLLARWPIMLGPVWLNGEKQMHLNAIYLYIFKKENKCERDKLLRFRRYCKTISYFHSKF